MYGLMGKKARSVLQIDEIVTSWREEVIKAAKVVQSCEKKGSTP